MRWVRAYPTPACQNTLVIGEVVVFTRQANCRELLQRLGKDEHGEVIIPCATWCSPRQRVIYDLCNLCGVHT